MRRAAALAAVAIGCGSGGKARTAVVEDAGKRGDATTPAASLDGASQPAATDAAASDAPKPATTGDVQVRVEWKDVPVVARAAPGKTACGTSRAPAVAPTTLWGIPDVLVIVDGAPASADPAARVVLAECALSPRIAIGSSLVIASNVDRPTTVTVAKRASLAALPAVSAARPITVQLPIAGHSVAPAVEPGAIYEVAADGETAWFVAATAAISDASGVVLVKDVPVGSHAIRAWLPPRGKQPGRFARGEVVVEPGDLAELTLQLE